MPNHVRYQLLVAGIAALVFFTGLGGTALWDDEEPRNALCVREMSQRGDWIVPTANGKLRTDKPPLTYWLIAGANQVFGESEFSIRFWSALCAVGTCVATYHLGARLYRPRVGLWAGLVMATALWCGFTGRVGTADSPFLCCMTVALLVFVKSAIHEGQWSALRWRDAVLLYAILALAALDRGPQALLLPGLAVLVFTVWSQSFRPLHSSSGHGLLAIMDEAFLFGRRMVSPRAFGNAVWSLRPLTGLLVLALLIAPWFVAVHERTGGAWTDAYWQQLCGPLGAEHASSIVGATVSYVPSLLLGLFPWSIFLPLALVRPLQRIHQQSADRVPYILLVCWVLVFALFSTLFEVKLASFALPAYPAIAVLIGAYLEHWFAAPGQEPKFWMRVAFVTLAVVGASVLVGVPIAASKILPGETGIGLLGLIPLVGGCTALISLETKRYCRAIYATAATATMLALAIFGVVARRLEPYKNSAHLAEVIARQGVADATVATYGYSSASLMYYANRAVQQLRDADAVAEYLQAAPHGFVVATADVYAELKPLLPRDVTVLNRQPRFLLENNEVLLLGRPTSLAQRPDGLKR